jgi:hypothetical protein
MTWESSTLPIDTGIPTDPFNQSIFKKIENTHASGDEELISFSPTGDMPRVVGPEGVSNNLKPIQRAAMNAPTPQTAGFQSPQTAGFPSTPHFPQSATQYQSFSNAQEEWHSQPRTPRSPQPYPSMTPTDETASRSHGNSPSSQRARAAALYPPSPQTFGVPYTSHGAPPAPSTWQAAPYTPELGRSRGPESNQAYLAPPPTANRPRRTNDPLAKGLPGPIATPAEMHAWSNRAIAERGGMMPTPRDLPAPHSGLMPAPRPIHMARIPDDMRGSFARRGTGERRPDISDRRFQQPVITPPGAMDPQADSLRANAARLQSTGPGTGTTGTQSAGTQSTGTYISGIQVSRFQPRSVIQPPPPKRPGRRPGGGA